MKIHTSELDSRIILDDVSQETSINPRACLNVQYISDYERDILKYLANGDEFSEVWGQRPQAVETDQETDMGGIVLMLTSGYHTITALKNVIKRIEDNPEEVDNESGVKLGDVEVDFDVIFQVLNVNKKMGYLEAARFHASFSNVHGQPLSSTEKSKAAYNALSVMNLTKQEGDETLFAHMTDRALASKLGCGKTTVFKQRQILIRERFPSEATEEGVQAESTTQESATTTDINATLESLNNDVQTESNENTADNGLDIDTSKKTVETKQDDRDSGTEGMDLGLAGSSTESEDENTDEDDAADAAETKQVQDTIKKMLSGASVTQLKSIIAVRECFDFLLSINADQLASAISSVDGQCKKAREMFSTLAADKDPEYSKGVDQLFGMFQISLENLCDENEERP